jgi:pyruvate dehydrogenase E2 component (dihydrolipoamide acetyltransferase)
MSVGIHMPSLGQTTDEMLIVEWLKAEGDAVAAGEPLLRVQTDKATLEVESITAGTLLAILCPAGETVQSGTAIACVGQPGEEVMIAADSSRPSSSTKSFHDAGLVSETPATTSKGLGLSIPRGQAGEPAPQPGSSTFPKGKRLASPAARQLAREHGIDLAAVPGSGPEGSIETRDVWALIEDCE